MKRVMTAGILLMALFLSACTAGQAKEAVSATVQTLQDNLFSASESETAEPEESAPEELPEAPAEEEEPEILPEETRPAGLGERILTFIDAYGQNHEAPVVEELKKNPYQNECFVRDGFRLSYEDEQHTSSFGIDVSEHQGEIDWTAVREAGVEFAMIRLGFRGYGDEGTLNLDSCFEENLKGAKEAGLSVGVYFFSQAVNEEEAAEEARFVLEHLDGTDAGMPVVFDPERIHDDDARTDSVSGEQFTRNARTFCGIIAENGYEPLIYSNLMWEAFEWDMKLLSDYAFWYADYQARPQTPYDFEYWQYSEKGEIPGIETYVDLDIHLIPKEG